MRAVKFFFFLQGKVPKEIHPILKETLGEHATSYGTVKNWVAKFKRGDFSTCDAPRPGRPKTVTTSEIIDHIYELILEDGRILAKSIARRTSSHTKKLFFWIYQPIFDYMTSTLSQTDANPGASFSLSSG